MNKLTATLLAAFLFLSLGSSCTLQNNNLTTQSETIQDAYWILVSLEGQNVQAPKDTRTAYIRFKEKDNDVTGYTGCNRISGRYTLAEQRLQLSKLSTTRMSCAEMQTENKMMEVLNRVNTYRIAGDVLTLYDGDQAVATFMTGNVELMENDLNRNLNNNNE